MVYNGPDITYYSWLWYRIKYISEVKGRDPQPAVLMVNWLLGEENYGPVKTFIHTEL